jgi:eukaryotic-like serine/threonine-protein kinase
MFSLIGSPILGGRGRLVAPIARGGMGEVWRALLVGAAGFERAVAVKFLHANLAVERDSVERFLDEARLAAQLCHPNIVQITDLELEDDHYLMVMELVDGVSTADLDRHLRGRGHRLEVGHVLHIVRALLAALAYAHAAAGPGGQPLRIVHRDVCPRNLLVARHTGTVKLVDFGVALAASNAHHTEAGMVVGKLSRMAPEQLHRLPVDHRADLFGAGVLLYELLTGVQPFGHLAPVDQLKPVLRVPLRSLGELRPDLDRRLDAIVARALAERADDRYPSAGVMLEDLAALPEPTNAAASLGALVATIMQSEAEASRRPPPPPVPTVEIKLVAGEGAGTMKVASDVLDAIAERGPVRDTRASRPSLEDAGVAGPDTDVIAPEVHRDPRPTVGVAPALPADADRRLTIPAPPARGTRA